MQEIFEKLKNILKKEISILWIFSVALGLALVALDIKNKLPLGTGDFVFISILALCFALYRPRWAFLLFVSLIPLENVILASGFLPMQLRPYQYAGAILAAAVAILWISKRLKFELLKPTWLDWLVFSLVPFSFLSLVNSRDLNISLKNNLILFSFVALYYLVRIFFRNKKDLADSAMFFLGSNLVVLIYGFYQVFADKFGGRSFEVMFGRPNSTFTEPDWLGIFLCFALAVLLSAIRFLEKKSEKYAAYILIFLNLTLLILTLSRSAWVGAAVVILFWLAFNLYRKSEIRTAFTLRAFADNLITIFFLLLASLAAVFFGRLSKFDLIDRARSATTNEQKITIACESGVNIPQTISSVDELAKYNCRHINLEEIAGYKSQGKFVSVVFRKDPNVTTRSQIYKKSFEIIKTHPVLGVGYGTITQALGLDERGAGLNESNIFLQVWTGSGILGLIAFAITVGYLFFSAFCKILKGTDNFKKNINLFLVLGVAALIVPNFFNAGLFMGLLWLGMGIFTSCIRIKQ